MKLGNYYYLKYSDYRPHLYLYNHTILADMSFGLLQVFHLELGSPHKISTGKTNEEYLHNTCTQSWLTDLEQFTPGVQIKGSVRDSVWTPEFDIKHLKKAKGHIGRNFVIITINIWVNSPNILSNDIYNEGFNQC